MSVIIDTHEKAEVTRLVNERCDEVETANDFGGDYIAGGHLFERKRWGELPDRMMHNENDLYTQLYRLKSGAEDMGVEPVLLLEGPPKEAVEYANIPLQNIVNYLAGAFKLDIKVMATPDMERTAGFLNKLESKNAGGDPSAVRHLPNVTPEDRPRYLVEGLPRCGPKTAESLLDHFGCARDVFTATADELEEVDGIGPATAAGIIDAAGSEY